MSDTTVFAALRTLAAATIAGGVDRSDDPNAVDPKSAPEFVVELERTSAERIAMGEDVFDVIASAQIEVFRQPATKATSRQEGVADAEALALAIVSDAAFGALVVEMSAPTTDVQVAPGDWRVVKATVGVTLQYTA